MGPLHAAFRNCQVAAPLKQRQVRKTAWGLSCLPQLSSCGPIEACALAELGAAIGRLPQLSSCGPIEAVFPAAAAAARRRLPQLSSCGPIEAAPLSG